MPLDLNYQNEIPIPVIKANENNIINKIKVFNKTLKIV